MRGAWRRVAGGVPALRARAHSDAPPPPPPAVADVVLGIDPDANGAMSVLSRGAADVPAGLTHGLQGVVDTPTVATLVGGRTRRRPDPAALAAAVGDAARAARAAGLTVEAALERPTPNSLNGKQSWFGSGYAFGLWAGALAAHGVRTTLVTARAWKGAAGLEGVPKDAARAAAAAELPAAAPLLARKKDHGRADALLIGLWRARGGTGVSVEPVEGGSGDDDDDGSSDESTPDAPPSAPPSAPPPVTPAAAAAGTAASAAGVPPLAPPRARLALAAYTLIIDDLVFADGATRMGVLGGSGPQTAWGYRAAAALLGGGAAAPPPRTAVCARVGADVPAAAVAWLAALGADTAALLPRPGGGPTPRAWQLVEADGARTQVWRTPWSEDLADALLPPVAALPATVVSAAAHHAGVNPLNPRHAAWLAALRAAAAPGARVSAETFQPAVRRLTDAELAALLAHVDRFSPNAAEAASMVGGDGGARGAAARLAAAGAPAVAVRCGADGALLLPAGSGGPLYSAPAVTPLAVVDTTGCGNAFLGALLAADAAAADPRDALAVASAVASVMAECVGVPRDAVVSGAALAVVSERADWVRGRVVVEEG